MQIAARELRGLTLAVFKMFDGGKGVITAEKHDDFIAWGMKTLNSLKGPIWEDDGLELPPQFVGLYRQFQKTADYKVDADSLLLEAEKARTSSPFTLRTPISTPTKAMKTNFLETFSQLTGATKGAFGGIESARRGGSDAEIAMAVRAAFTALAMEKQASVADPIEKFLHRNPEQRLLWSGIGRKMCGGRATLEEANAMEEAMPGCMKALTAGLVPGDALGTGLPPVPVSPDVWDLLLTYGAFRDLGVRPMGGQYTKFAQVTGLPDAYVFSPAKQGTAAPPVDRSLGGKELDEAANTFICWLQVSLAWISDPKFDVASAVLSRIIPGLAKRVDWCAFQGTGVDDLLNAGQTGLFVDETIPTYAPALVGKTNILALDRVDFLNVVGAVAPAALQRPCRWFIYPGFIPKLLQLKEGEGNTYLLKTPAETQGEWHLVGFPVTWAAQAPALDQANAKVAAFGEPSSYLVALREEMEIMSSDSSGFAQALRDMRGIMRGKCQTRDATGLATLKLAAQ
jgi:HK97 family phage major capsid protein